MLEEIVRESLMNHLFTSTTCTKFYSAEGASQSSFGSFLFIAQIKRAAACALASICLNDYICDDA